MPTMLKKKVLKKYVKILFYKTKLHYYTKSNLEYFIKNSVLFFTKNAAKGAIVLFDIWYQQKTESAEKCCFLPVIKILYEFHHQFG